MNIHVVSQQVENTAKAAWEKASESDDCAMLCDFVDDAVEARTDLTTRQKQDVGSSIHFRIVRSYGAI